MITARENISLMAEAMGCAEAEIRTTDKFLSDAGLRRKTVGRSRVHMSKKEMIIVLLATMGAPVKTNPVGYAKDVQEFRLSASGIYCPTGTPPSPDQYAGLIGVSLDELEELALIDVLQKVVGFLAKNNPNPNAAQWSGRVWLEVEMNGSVTIQVATGDFRVEIPFIGKMDYRSGDLRRTSRVSQATLIWIGLNGVEAE